MSNKISAEVDGRGMSGRISCWAAPPNLLWTEMGMRYAAAWINGDVPQEQGIIDMDALIGFGNEFLAELGTNANIYATPLMIDGEEIGHIVLALVDYVVY